MHKQANRKRTQNDVKDLSSYSSTDTYSLWYYIISKKYNISLGGKPSGLFLCPLGGGRIAKKAKAILLLSRMP